MRYHTHGNTHTDTHTHTHSHACTKPVWCGVEPNGFKNGTSDVQVRAKASIGQQTSLAAVEATAHIASQSPMADQSSRSVMHLTSHARREGQVRMCRGRTIAQMPMPKEIAATLPPSDSLHEIHKLGAREENQRDARLLKPKTSLGVVGGWKPSPSGKEHALGGHIGGKCCWDIAPRQATGYSSLTAIRKPPEGTLKRAQGAGAMRRKRKRASVPIKSCFDGDTSPSG